VTDSSVPRKNLYTCKKEGTSYIQKERNMIKSGSFFFSFLFHFVVCVFFVWLNLRVVCLQIRWMKYFYTLYTHWITITWNQTKLFFRDFFAPIYSELLNIYSSIYRQKERYQWVFIWEKERVCTCTYADKTENRKDINEWKSLTKNNSTHTQNKRTMHVGNTIPVYRLYSV
jgi:hypothetical protein